MPRQLTAQTGETIVPSHAPGALRHSNLLLTRLAKRGLARVVEAGPRVVGPHYSPFLWLVRHAPPRTLYRVGRWRAEAAAWRAIRDVPAYARHVTGSQDMTTVGGLVLPSTDKESYVKRYPVAERCRGGSLPARGVMIDESSGSSGTPYNWVRADKERRASHLFISHFTRYCFGGEPWVTINAFSMGAWATGINMGVALERNGLLKNTGPDIYKILGTLEFIGPDRRYLIRGYPPFLKLLIDEARHNPLQHHITINDDGELIFTISPAVQASSRRALPTMSTMRAESCDSTR